jgi:hypothetical protein
MATSPVNESPTIENTTRSASVRRMFLGFDLHAWEGWLLAGVGIVAIGGVVVAAATYAVIKLQRLELARSAKELAEYQKQAKIDIAAANTTAETAKKQAADAQLALETYKAPRWITDSQRDRFVAQLGRFQNITVDVWLLHAPSADAAPFAERLLEVLSSPVGWSAKGVFSSLGGRTGFGVRILIPVTPTADELAAARVLMYELFDIGLTGQMETRQSDDPRNVFGAFTGPGFPNSRLWVVVGSKP